METKPTMIFVHGWGLHSGVWQPLIELLKGQYDCLCVDLPGYGERSGQQSPNSLEALADDLLQSTPEQAHWCAWSLGGMAALQAATRTSQHFRSLTLICSTPRFTHGKDWPKGMNPAVFSKFSNELETDYHSGIKKFLLLQAGAGTVARDSVKKTTALLKKYPEPSKETLRSGLAILEDSDLRHQLSTVDVPCRVLSGRLDRIVHPNIGQHLSSLLGNSEHIELNSGHAPHLSHTQELADILKQPVGNSVEATR